MQRNMLRIIIRMFVVILNLVEVSDFAFYLNSWDLISLDYNKIECDAFKETPSFLSSSNIELNSYPYLKCTFLGSHL